MVFAFHECSRLPVPALKLKDNVAENHEVGTLIEPPIIVPFLSRAGCVGYLVWVNRGFFVQSEQVSILLFFGIEFLRSKIRALVG